MTSGYDWLITYRIQNLTTNASIEGSVLHTTQYAEFGADEVQAVKSSLMKSTWQFKDVGLFHNLHIMTVTPLPIRHTR